MIFGIGTDVVEVERFRALNYNKVAQRVLSQQEFKFFEKSKYKHLFIAKKFSIKESISKAFGCGIGKRLSFKDITITNNKNGKPVCFVESSVVQYITGCESVDVHVSITDTKTLVQTFAVVEILQQTHTIGVENS